ncbi:Asp-tRNA(Asn)/Glu-tRNA(Gln) amidotransferase subunit GatC [Streptobacillus moniliformis]|uniref:Aspartyl/glutamyl-tRNA(Asn/Gln) amidotransferase subunit C n=1 Tax=Streptobacillus moniliformis (strain ATCC 14647 / DSM 12112 / NCTC 10651 / 9901) TaxID=519441 RepID=D1AX25_STRM9|nr:Asp-tRNA(Asn)/Glu-tRNA(Gln) amidotransferase subunit GatC [Streptobacillus moniliformis]ACZ00851.1 glutamyl-tRNA(Gln) amidotransferase, C subunit [Streptobacillus moniliformis DSM 12112]AVL42758.1 Asp-tRNA(Asn)/Glu-tRNA(Gln) amidotransferase subunit GatC [Streptobacillus moniliformis]QXW65599.1 Asp-tRNA(Asn)/Glu-tRNA(Gln) amidotransferase subunit GatC [Streptobacillus moniliformis]SQA14014.1 Glutamyl-tRNA(Gln) amidotransferase subunit C [Streptobacillus moniliformis]
MVTKEEVVKLAKLSKLSFEKNELEAFQKDLNDIFKYMESLNELNLENVEPLYNILENEGKIYKHEPKIEMDKKMFLENAPKNDENFISIPVMLGDGNE